MTNNTYPLAVGHFSSLGGDWYIVLDSNGQPIAKDQLGETTVMLASKEDVKVEYIDYQDPDNTNGPLYIPIAALKAWLIEYERLNGVIK